MNRRREATDGVADLDPSMVGDPDHGRVPADQRVLRTDLDHALTRTMAYLSPLLLLQSIPSYLAQRDPASALGPLVLLLAALPCALILVALRVTGDSSPRLLLLSASVYLPVAAVEALEARPLLPQAYLPWLLVVAPVFIPSLALGARTVRTWVLGNVLGLAAVLVVYAPRLPLDRSLMTVFSITVFSIGAFAGIRALRRRADTADAARLAASARYEQTQRRTALEQERVRTDALIHDSLLNALLGAVAAATAPASRADAVQRAEETLTVLDGTDDGAEHASLTGSRGDVAEVLARELRPLRGVLELRLDAGSGIAVPHPVRDAFVSAALQAVNNSIKHAGGGARRRVTLEPMAGGGLRLTVQDDGRGFDPAGIDAERLGVRVSIVKRVATAGGRAEVVSAPGRGTSVVLTWPPVDGASRQDPERSDAALRPLVHA